MGRTGELARLAFAAALAASPAACARGCGTSGGVATTGSASASAAAPAPGPSGPAVANAACAPGRDSVACTPDGLEAVTCAGGVWRTLQSCRGPGHCKGAGSTLQCDPGEPQPGDACVPSRTEPRCRDAQHLLACTGGRWTESACGPGKTCGPPVRELRDAAGAAGAAGEIGGQVGCR